MKIKLQSFYLFTLLGTACFLYSCGQLSNTKNSISDKEIGCDDALWEHVYNAYRLKVIEKCKTVKGIIVKKKNEPDGDIHILLRLDSGQSNLLNEMNYKEEKGCLVIEPICAHRVLQPDAISSCEGYINNVYIPGIGEHVEVTGSYVTDTKHGWNEIHPITKVVVIKN